MASSCYVYLFGVTQPHLRPGNYHGTLVIVEYVANISGYATTKSEAKGVRCFVPAGRCNSQFAKAKLEFFRGMITSQFGDSVDRHVHRT